MIPKIIHYCWFGGNPLPQSAIKCINSWRKYLPDYEIKEWNEDNFDVNIIPYSKEAYEAKKYAFVSDYARFWVLYRYGGLYFDTDVEVIRPMDEIIQRGPFMGVEAGAAGAVAPGLGLGATPHLDLYKELLDYYNDLHYCNQDGQWDGMTSVTHTTKVLSRNGLQMTDDLQEIAGIWIYPADYFCPMDHTTGITTITPRTVSIHHYDASWRDHRSWHYVLHVMKNFVFRLLGSKLAHYINNVLH